jgi:hypothetical protein
MRILVVTISVLVSVILLGGCLKTIDTGLDEESVQGEFVPRMPGGWMLYGRVDGQEAFDFLGGYDTEIKRSGSRSFCVFAVSVTSDDQARLTQRFSAESFRGRRVRFSGYLKANRVSEWAGLWMRVDTDTKQAYAFDDMEDRSVSGTAEWTLGEVVLDIPDDAVSIYLGAHLFGRGQLWVDECRFEVVGDDVPTTDKYRLQGGYNRRFAIPNFLRDEPLNLDFDEDEISL